MSQPTLETPMLRQYQTVKAEYPDAIVFFRLGDFYEMFLDDAVVASKLLDLTLTGRGKEENRVPMCGIPYHSAAPYIDRLIAKGFKVAICEQVEDASVSKGLTRREVVKVITPGTLMAQSALPDRDHNFLAAYYEDPKTQRFGLSWVDISTGEFWCSEFSDADLVHAHLQTLRVRELLIPEGRTVPDMLTMSHSFYTPLPAAHAAEELCRHFQVNSLSGFGIQMFPASFPASLGILFYVRQTQKAALPHLHKLMPYHPDHHVFLDPVTVRNLELVAAPHSSDPSSSLSHTLDETQTALGGRRLRYLIQHPFRDRGTLESRLDAVEQLTGNPSALQSLRQVLSQVYDLERIVSRIVSYQPNPRDLVSLGCSLKAIGLLPSVVGGFLRRSDSRATPAFSDGFSEVQGCTSEKAIGGGAPALESDLGCVGDEGVDGVRVEGGGISLSSIVGDLFRLSAPGGVFQRLISLIESAITDDPPPTLRDGGVIRVGYALELDDLLESFRSIREWIATLEAREREITGIKTLKVGFNKVFGYYLDISKAQADRVPPHYMRKQTLSNNERFITPELKEKEIILLQGEAKQIQLEAELYLGVVKRIEAEIPALHTAAKLIAELDLFQSLAYVASRFGYTRPVFSDPGERVLHIEDGRHPVLERKPGFQYIPNSLDMHQNALQFMLITGPNMAGKSTVMRMAGLLTVLAQIGSFVPARLFRLSICDQIFTRIGALDNVYHGQSTFMVEMLETASILHTATSQSLILLDEIGRGTATFDGMSIAYSICEYILTRLHARSFFATHYHELTVLADRYAGIDNFNMAIVEADGTLIFQYRLEHGAANKSYGIQVGRMAGLPSLVIERATQLLEGFEQKGLPFLETVQPLAGPEPEVVEERIAATVAFLPLHTMSIQADSLPIPDDSDTDASACADPADLNDQLSLF